MSDFEPSDFDPIDSIDFEHNLQQQQSSWQDAVHMAARAALTEYVHSWLELPHTQYSAEHSALLLSKTWHLGALDACLQVCDQILTNQPDELSVTVRKGACLIRLGRLAEAVRVLEPTRLADETALQGYALLQLGNALRYQGNRDRAGEVLLGALERAEQRRDGGLVIAVRTALGELALDSGQLETAIEMLGKALGLTEFFSDERLTIAPLGALAHAHALWKNPSKTFDLAARAVTRAQPTVDRVGAARAKWASAYAASVREPRREQTAYALADALADAQVAPHVPLLLRIGVADMQQRVNNPRHAPTVTEVQGWLEHANAAGMQTEQQQLTKLETQLSER